MSEEELIDYIMDIDRILGEAESSLEGKKYIAGLNKLKKARQLIDDLRQEDCSDNSCEVGMDVMNKMK